MLIEVFEAEKSRMRWYYTFAYGVPLVIVCVSCVVDPLSYGTDRYCWLRADNFFIFSFVGPVIAVILVSILPFCNALSRPGASEPSKNPTVVLFQANLVFLSMAIYMMCRHSNASVSMKSKEHSRLASARYDTNYVFISSVSVNAFAARSQGKLLRCWKSLVVRRLNGFPVFG